MGLRRFHLLGVAPVNFSSADRLPSIGGEGTKSVPFRRGTVRCSLPVGDPLLEVTSAELPTFHASGSQVSSPVFVSPQFIGS